jgi:hypothetical protein
MEKETSDTILERLRGKVEAKLPPPREEWLKNAFELMVLRMDEAKLFNKMHRGVAESKMGIINKQEGKKSVALADAEVESLESYQFMKDQEDKIYTIDELTRIAKKGSDINL